MKIRVVYSITMKKKNSKSENLSPRLHRRSDWARPKKRESYEIDRHKNIYYDIVENKRQNL